MSSLFSGGQRCALIVVVALLVKSSESNSLVAKTLDNVPITYQLLISPTVIRGTQVRGLAGGEARLSAAVSERSRVVAGDGSSRLQPGDADQDLDFDQADLVRVLIAGRYLTGQSATWGQGDWNGAPGGRVGEPPPGDNRFDHLDIIAALDSPYRDGPYAAVAPGGQPGDGQTSIGYVANTGTLWIDAPLGEQLASFEVTSASGIFTGQPARYVSLDSSSGLPALSDVTGGNTFGSFSFGPVASVGLAEAFLLGDLTVTGTLASGGGLGQVDLIYTVPEPSAVLLAVLGIVTLLVGHEPRRRVG
jgi:hypothetical protein